MQLNIQIIVYRKQISRTVRALTDQNMYEQISTILKPKVKEAHRTNERESNIWNYTYVTSKLIFKKQSLYSNQTTNMKSLGTYSFKLHSHGLLSCQTSTCQRLPRNWVLMTLFRQDTSGSGGSCCGQAVALSTLSNAGVRPCG